MIDLLLIKPKFIILFVTYRCNSKCIMCYAWQKQSKDKELSVEDIDNLFSDKTLSASLERINITGGEPTLYPHLLDAAEIFIRRCSRLKSIDMPTNGLDTSTILEKVEMLLAALFHSDIRLSITVSLDGIGQTAEKVRNVPQAFEKIDRTVSELLELRDLYKTKLSVNLNATISRINFDNLEELRNYALEKNVGINFTPAAISEIGVESIKKQNEFLMSRYENEQVCRFFEKLMKNYEITDTYGSFVINWLRGRKRKIGCIFRQRKAVLVEPTGDVYLCGNFKDFKIGNLLQARLRKPPVFNRINFGKEYKIKCETCNSNCYIGNIS